MAQHQIKILFLSANPSDRAQLQLDEELRLISQRVRRGEYRKLFDIRTAPATRATDLPYELMDHCPEIVHFSGHGTGAGELLFRRNEDGTAHSIGTQTLARVFRQLSGKIKCVVLNACYSEVQARAIVEAIPCVIGMSSAVPDATAIAFAAGFYEALAFGKCIAEAFELGLAQIELSGCAPLDTADIPRLLVRSGSDASRMVLVEPGRTSADTVGYQPRSVFQIPVSLSAHFTGRQDTLTGLRQRLCERRVVALWGLGGLGKTQTAIAYAHSHRGDYSTILWISGDSAASFEQGLFDIGLPLSRAGRLARPYPDESDAVAVRRAVREYLQSATDYLLICDNVDTPHSLRAVWPGASGFGGHVVLTSRTQDCRQLGAVVFELGKLPPCEAKAYLSSNHRPQNAEEEAASLELAQELDGLPLALAQAAAFLVEHQSRYVDYLRQYRKQRLWLLEQGLPTGYPKSVATTWAISIELIQKAQGAALDLLKLLALLSPESVPEELFAHPVVELGEPLYCALGASSGLARDALALDRLLKPLLGHALVQRDRENQVFSLHRLVQQVLLQWISSEDQRCWARAVIALLDAAFPVSDVPNWSRCRRLIPHIPTVVDHIDRFNLMDRAAARLLNNAGHFLNDQGQYLEADPLLRKALIIRETILEGGHPDIGESLNNLGKIQQDQGNMEEAEALYRRALEVRENALGPAHPDVAESLNNLGMLLLHQGKYDEAGPLHRRGLAIRERALGNDHADVAMSLNNLAGLLYAQGNLGEAEPLYRRALTIWTRTLGDEHPRVATTLNNLGSLLHTQGKLDEAERNYRRGLDIVAKVLPEGHPLIKKVEANLVALLSSRRERRYSPT